MLYKEFLDQICEKLETMLPDDTNFHLQKVYRNNGLVLDALIISNEESNVSPAIFLNYYYEEKNRNPDFDSICKDICRTYEHNRATELIQADFFTNYEQVQKQIAYRIINYDKNKELLKTVPHIQYLDFAIVFYCLLHISEQNNATILIHTEHLDMWQITLQQLHKHALASTPQLLPYDCRNMSLVFQEFLEEYDIPSPADAHFPLFPMYLLTNTHKLYGASCLLYPDLLKQISEKLDSDLFILPSSIHELILLPAEDQSQADLLADMVYEINRTELSADEILSDHVYYYSKEDASLIICK